SLLKDVATELSEYFSEEIEDEDIEKGLKNLVESFEEFGFYPSLSEENGEYVLDYKNCVFGEMEGEPGNQLCEMHRKIVEESLEDVDVEIEKTSLSDNRVCVHRISK
ncbi:MAG: methanogen output domain 1-containing protein, partial [Candidatus Aenigmatarchaeota archaeon]